MSTYLYLPTGLTFSDIRDGLPAQSLPALNAYLASVGAPAVAVGDNNPLVLKLNDFDMGGAAFLRGPTNASLSECGPIDQINHIPLGYVQLIDGVGGYLEGFKVFFELAEAELDSEVPASFPDRVDPETDEARTWRTWIGYGHQPEKIGDKWYRSSANPFGGGDPIRSNAWSFAGLTVKTVHEFLAIRDANQPEV